MSRKCRKVYLIQRELYHTKLLPSHFKHHGLMIHVTERKSIFHRFLCICMMIEPIRSHYLCWLSLTTTKHIEVFFPSLLNCDMIKRNRWLITSLFSKYLICHLCKCSYKHMRGIVPKTSTEETEKYAAAQNWLYISDKCAGGIIPTSFF